MRRETRTVIISAAATLAVTVGAALLASWLPWRTPARESVLDGIMNGTLGERMEEDSTLVCGMVSLKETGRAKEPRTQLLFRTREKALLISGGEYDMNRVTVLPESLMQAATLTYFMDRWHVGPDDLVPTQHGTVPTLEGEGTYFADPKILAYERTTGRDSISVREGFAMSSRYVADWMAVGDRRRLDDARWHFNEKFYEYFGSSECCYIPEARYRLLPVAASVADGSGVLLSQRQILTFVDAIANGGVRPRHRYVRPGRICSEETARQLTALLRENVTAGAGVPLADHPVRIAGKTGSGALPFGYVPGRGNVGKADSLRVATFAGFFPADAPRYTMCVTLYSDTGEADLERGAMAVFGELVTKLKEEGML